MSPATPYVIPLSIFLFYGVYCTVAKCCGLDQAGDDDDNLYQALEAFFKSLKAKTREAWLREEVNCKKNLDIAKLSEEAFTRLAKFKDDGSKTGAPKLTGVHNYDILANPYYADQYHYIPAVYPKREEYVISEHTKKELRLQQVDLVRLVTDLAYLPEERARKLQFNVEYLANEERIKGFMKPDNSNTYNANSVV